MMRAFVASILFASSGGASGQLDVPIRDDALRPFGVEISETRFGGSRALRLSDSSGQGFALVEAELRDGEIEVQVAGTVDAEASFLTRHFARGFIGVVFRVQADHERYEKIYLRPTNARADDQLRRNHSTQYESLPDHPWRRLRKESPGRYESYVDLEPGVWTKMRIVMSGETAELYVGEDAQPCLIVQDLKLGEASGGIGLWVGPGTVGYFRDLRVSPGESEVAR